VPVSLRRKRSPDGGRVGLTSDGRRARSLARIFAVPLLLAGLTAFGLAAALVGEGGWHVAAWLALLAPVATALWFVARAGWGERVRRAPG
jgi:hypothetical protein